MPLCTVRVIAASLCSATLENVSPKQVAQANWGQLVRPLRVEVHPMVASPQNTNAGQFAINRKVYVLPS